VDWVNVGLHGVPVTSGEDAMMYFSISVVTIAHFFPLRSTHSPSSTRRLTPRRSADDVGMHPDVPPASGTSSSSSSFPSSSTKRTKPPGCKTALGPDDVVLIVGGGIAGLALAAQIHTGWCDETDDGDDAEKRGPRCLVFERDASASARRQGYGVTLSETNGALRGLGAWEALRASSTKSTAHWTFSASGRVLGYYGGAFLDGKNETTTSSEGGDDKPTNLRVPRNVVREILLKKIPKDWLRWGERMKDYIEDESGVTLTLESGETVRGTILVAADGVRSAVRRAPNAGGDLKSGGELRYLGVALCTGFTDLNHALLRRQGFYTVDGRSRMFTMPFEAANEERGTPPRSMWQLSVRVDEETARALSKAPRSEVKSFVLEHTQGWHEPVSDMFDHTDWEDAWAGPLYDREEPPVSRAQAKEKPHMTPRASSSRVICIGDAAHPMSPFKGQGANTALFDAWSLAKWLKKAPPHTALACFYREMVTRAFVKVRASREACEHFHSPAILTERIPEFAGIEPTKIKLVLEELNARGITAPMGADLEDAVRATISELGASEIVKPYAAKKQLLECETKSDAGSGSEVSDTTFASSAQYGILSEHMAKAVSIALDQSKWSPLAQTEHFMAGNLRANVSGRRPSNNFMSCAPIRILASRGFVGESLAGQEAKLARQIADVIEEQQRLRLSEEGETLSNDEDDYFVRAKPTADGKILLTTKRHDDVLTSLGLRQCDGCLKYYAVHGGGLRQHWTVGGEGPDCAAAARAAMDNETEFESSSWRGSGAGKPKAWRNSNNRKELSPGMSAASRGDVEAMRRAIAEGWDALNEKDAFGSNALMWAAGGGFVEACAFLVDECGMHPNHTARKDGRVPLHWAARNGELDTCKWLVERGADPRVPSYDGDYPFHLAIWKNHRHVAEWFTKNPDFDCGTTNRWGCNAVLWACTTETDQDEALSMVKWLVEEQHVSHSVINVNGHSALHKCAIYGHESVIDYLLEKIDTACLDAYLLPDDRNQAPSELARVNGFFELESKLRHIEDKTLKLPALFDASLALRATS